MILIFLYGKLLAIDYNKAFIMYYFSIITNLLKFSAYNNNLPAQTIFKISSIQVVSNTNNLRNGPKFFNKSIQCSCTLKYYLKLNLFLSVRLKIVIIG